MNEQMDRKWLWEIFNLNSNTNWKLSVGPAKLNHLRVFSGHGPWLLYQLSSSFVGIQRGFLLVCSIAAVSVVGYCFASDVYGIPSGNHNSTCSPIDL